MINPQLLGTKTKRWNDPRFAGGKYYLAVLAGEGFVKAAHRIFKRASDAEAYAVRLRLRWMRLYDAAVLAMVQS
jgi:hypothetical protein